MERKNEIGTKHCLKRSNWATLLQIGLMLSMLCMAGAPPMEAASTYISQIACNYSWSPFGEPQALALRSDGTVWQWELLLPVQPPYKLAVCQISSQSAPWRVIPTTHWPSGVTARFGRGERTIMASLEMVQQFPAASPYK